MVVVVQNIMIVQGKECFEEREREQLTVLNAADRSGQIRTENGC